MAVPWIKVQTNLPSHPKIFALAEELGVDSRLLLPEIIATGIIINLWTWALTNQPDGDLNGVSNRAIARICGWLGKPDKLVDALVVCGFIDADRRIHDWEEYTLLYNDAEEQNKAKTRERVQRYRERNKGVTRYDDVTLQSVTRNDGVTEDVTPCNADVTLQCNADVTLQGVTVTVPDKNKIRRREEGEKNNHISNSFIKEKEKQEKEKEKPPQKSIAEIEANLARSQYLFEDDGPMPF